MQRTMTKGVLLWSALLPGLAVAAEPKNLPLSEAPFEIQEVITKERSLRGSEVVELSITPADLDHDGQEEWLVRAFVRDRAGFGQVNQPTWVFQKQGGPWRKLAFLGARVQVEVLPQAGGYDSLKVLTKDGVRQRTTTYSFKKGRYEPR